VSSSLTPELDDPLCCSGCPGNDLCLGIVVSAMRYVVHFVSVMWVMAKLPLGASAERDVGPFVEVPPIVAPVFLEDRCDLGLVGLGAVDHHE
jgi:hypothetical protein